MQTVVLAESRKIQADRHCVPNYSRSAQQICAKIRVGRTNNSGPIFFRWFANNVLDIVAFLMLNICYLFASLDCILFRIFTMAYTSQLAVANAKFALVLYNKQAAPAASNIFISPLSISIALSMTFLGARTNTKKQMADVLHFGELEDEKLHAAFKEIRESMNAPGQPFKLFIANRLFGEKSYQFLEEYLTASDKHYGAKLQPVDFV